MSIKAVLFDLDGTLLPMDLDEFVGGYLKLLAAKLAPYGFEPKTVVKAIWAGTDAMGRNDGSRLNEDAFWETFRAFYPDLTEEHKLLFEEFYAVDFEKARSLCGFEPEAAKAVSALREMGLRTALSTNPFFPCTATYSRVRWAGCRPEDFELITTYENSRRCKPNPRYFLDVAEAMGLRPEECLVVGNDTGEDGAALKIGMKLYLITPCLIDRGNLDLGSVPHGDFPGLLSYVRESL